MGLKTIKYVKIDDQSGSLYVAEKQSLLVPVDFIKTIHSIFVNLVGKEGAEILIYKIGEGLGKGYVQSLEYILKKEKVEFSKETKIKVACDAIFMESGWGRVRVCKLDLVRKTGEIKIVNSPSSIFLRKGRYDLERGVLAGVYEEVVGEKVYYDLSKVNTKKREVTLVMIDKPPAEILEKEKLTLLSRKQLHDKIEQATQDIVKEKEKVTSVISSLVDGLIMLDKQGKIIMINPQAEKYFNIKQEQVVGKKINKIGLCDCLYSLFKQAKQVAGEKILTKEISVFCQPKKEQEMFLNITAKAVVASGGEIIGYILVAHDITREKMVERLKNEFISISAHQLRTPLSAVKWTLQMILGGDMGEVNREAREYINKAYQSNERMITLVNDLLNISRIEEGRFLYNLELVSIKDLIEEVISSSAVLSAKRKVKIKFNIPTGKPLKTKADFKKIKLAIQNLVDNAIKYSIPGSEVIINLKQIKEGKNNFIEIEIKDQGIGINKKDQKRLFTKFFRGENAVRLQTEGSGLGLFIVKNIIEAHNGEIWFKSEENKGSTFYVKLPVNLDNE